MLDLPCTVLQWVEEALLAVAYVQVVGQLGSFQEIYIHDQWHFIYKSIVHVAGYWSYLGCGTYVIIGGSLFEVTELILLLPVWISFAVGGSDCLQ